VVAAVVDADEAGSRPKHAGDLRETRVHVCEVVEHPVARHDVELAVPEREPLDLRHLGAKPAAPRRVDGRRRGVDADDLGHSDQRGELAGAAARVEYAARTRLGDELEDQTPRLVLTVEPGGSVEPPRGEPLRRRVLACDHLRVAEPAHRRSVAVCAP
jgi:hypothetical protein